MALTHRTNLAGVGRQHPAERKRLDYLRERRNWYGESARCSRRAVRSHKSARHRADRRHLHAGLSDLGRTTDPDAAEDVQLRTARRRPGSWRKLADEPLANVIAYQLDARARAGMTEHDRVDAKLAAIRRRLGSPQREGPPYQERASWHDRARLARWQPPRR